LTAMGGQIQDHFAYPRDREETNESDPRL
jgi:hypothetical protein